MFMKATIVAHNKSQEALFLRKRMGQFKKRLLDLCNLLEDDVKIKYTGWYVLLKKDGESFKSLGTFNPDISDSEIEPEWDLCLPIPELDSLHEFMGW